MKTYNLQEICVECALDQDTVTTYIEREWVAPADPVEQSFDFEDLARIRLIRELQNDFNVNEEGVDLILHLLDNVHGLLARASSAAMR